MSTFYVRKDGSGTHTTIQSAIMAAVDNDIIDIGEGLFEESLDVYKGVKLYGAGKDKTTIQGSYRTNVAKTGTWALASKTISIPGGTAGFEVGRIVTGTGLVANSRIESIGPTSITVNLNTTAARATLSPITMVYQNDACVRVRGGTSSAFAEFKDLKVIGNNGIAPENPATEYSAVYFRNTGLGTNYCQYTVMDNCHIEANGEYALLADYGAAVGNITIKNCLINGKSFVGSNPNSGNQFSVANVPRQLVAFQSVNLPITFINNRVEGITGGLTTLGVPSFNTAVTIDAPNSTVTGNTIKGTYGYGYALRIRGAGSTVSNNVNHSLSSNPNSGYLIGPTGAQTAGLDIGTNSSITKGLVASTQSSAGQNIISEMSKELVSALSGVSSDAAFSSVSSWSMVSYVFKHSESNKRLVSTFKNFDGFKSMKLKSGMASGQSFQLHKIIVKNSSGSLKVVKRADITDASSFDFTLK
jgi:hypothetical protein